MSNEPAPMERATGIAYREDEVEDLKMVRVMSEAEAAKFELDPLDLQDGFAAQGYEAAPSTLALDRGDTICGVLDGYGPSEADGTPTLTTRRPAGSMWIVVPLEIAWQCERYIGTEVAVRRRHDGSYVVEPRRPWMKDSKITRRQVIADGRVQRAEIERALRRDDARTCRRGSSPRRCSTRRASRRRVGGRRLSTKKAAADPDGEPPRHRHTPTIGGARSSSGGQLPRRNASTGRDLVALKERR
jgi:hypothetical protein